MLSTVIPKPHYQIFIKGFATLYEFYLVSLIYDKDRLMDTFLLNVVQPVLEYDGHDVRAMNHYVESPAEIEDLFDLIAYEKGMKIYFNNE